VDVLKGCRVLPAGVWGVPRNLFFSLLPPQAASKKKEKGFYGDTPNPGRGLAALCTPA